MTKAQEQRFSSAVWPDDRGDASLRKRETHGAEQAIAFCLEGEVLDPQWQDGGDVAHAHPANLWPMRLAPKARPLMRR